MSERHRGKVIHLTGPVLDIRFAHDELPALGAYVTELSNIGVDGIYAPSANLHRSAFGGRNYEYMLHSLLPSGMIGMFMKMSGIPSERKCSEITKAERKQVISLLKCFSLTIKGFRPIEEAVITSGGVDIKEIDPKTMRSRLIDGLYFAGEVIDTDAYTGGFNLQAAFSTGVVAGEN